MPHDTIRIEIFGCDTILFDTIHICTVKSFRLVINCTCRLRAAILQVQYWNTYSGSILGVKEFKSQWILACILAIQWSETACSKSWMVFFRYMYRNSVHHDVISIQTFGAKTNIEGLVAYIISFFSRGYGW